jgi:hypothetical protein
LIEKLTKQGVRGLETLLQETHWWLRSAKQAEADQRPLARLQNPESQATYASYMIRVVCFFLRILTDEESRVDEYLLQRSWVVHDGDEASSGDAGTESEYDAASTDNNSVAPPRRPQKNVQVNKMEDGRELFKWKDGRKALGIQLRLVLDSRDRAA